MEEQIGIHLDMYIFKKVDNITEEELDVFLDSFIEFCENQGLLTGGTSELTTEDGLGMKRYKETVKQMSRRK